MRLDSILLLPAFLAPALPPSAPGVSVTIVDVDHDGSLDAKITGTGASEIVTIVENGALGLVVSADANGDGDFDDAGDVKNLAVAPEVEGVFVFMSGGNDVVNIAPGQDISAAKRHYFVDLGAGNDTFNYNKELLGFVNSQSKLIFDINGGAGADALVANFYILNASNVTFNADLGAGNDTAALSCEGQLVLKSVFDVRLSLGAGNDTCSYHFNYGLCSGAVSRHWIDGNAGNELFTFLLASVVDSNSIFEFRADGDRGNDTFSIDARGLEMFNNESSAAGGRASLSFNGGDGKDNIRIADPIDGGGGSTAKLDGFVELFVSGGPQDDILTIDYGALGAFTSSNTAAKLRGMAIRIGGGAGNDTITSQLSNDANMNGFFDVFVEGGFGNDNIIWGFENVGSSNVTFGPGGFMVVDGGEGTDAKVATGNGSVAIRRFE